MKTAAMAIIKKDMREITANRQLFLTVLVVPLVLTIVVPSVFLLVSHFMPEDMSDLEQLLSLLPETVQGQETETLMASLLLNYIQPMFFLIIPVMAASVMAASSFVGEREQRTLETLVYCPLTVRQLFFAKVMASFLMSMLVTWLSFLAMVLALGAEILLLAGSIPAPGVSWLFVMLLLSPSMSLIAITLIVRGSARAQNVMEAQQRAVFLILPLVFLVVGQVSGLMLLNAGILAALSLVLALLAWVLIKTSMRKFTVSGER